MTTEDELILPPGSPTLVEYFIDENGKIGRTDGKDKPSFIKTFEDGSKALHWCMNDCYHRIGGPAIITKKGKHRYFINGYDVSKSVQSWLNEHGYVWKTMTHDQKDELRVFMNNLDEINDCLNKFMPFGTGYLEFVLAYKIRVTFMSGNGGK